MALPLEDRGEILTIDQPHVQEQPDPLSPRSGG